MQVSVFRRSKRCACTDAGGALAVACRPYAAEFVQNQPAGVLLVANTVKLHTQAVTTNAGHSAHIRRHRFLLHTHTLQ